MDCGMCRFGLDYSVRAKGYDVPSFHSFLFSLLTIPLPFSSQLAAISGVLFISDTHLSCNLIQPLKQTKH